MKKVLVFALVAVLLLSCAFCGLADASDSVQVDEGLIFVDVTLPASYFEDLTEEEFQQVLANAEEMYSKCVVNSDGSVTYTMTKAQHKEMLDEYMASVEEGIAGLLEGEEEIVSFVDIKHNDDLSQVDIYVDTALYGAFDSFASLTFFIAGSYYQSFAGVPEDEIEIVVSFIDNATMETFDVISYQEWIASLMEEE